MRGARVVYTRVPLTAPKADELTATEKVVLLKIVAVRLALTATQFPVPPLIVTSGFELASKPCPPLTVNTTGLAWVADAIEILGDVGCTEAARQMYKRSVPLYVSII